MPNENPVTQRENYHRRCEGYAIEWRESKDDEWKVIEHTRCWTQTEAMDRWRAGFDDQSVARKKWSYGKRHDTLRWQRTPMTIQRGAEDPSLIRLSRQETALIVSMIHVALVRHEPCEATEAAYTNLMYRLVEYAKVAHDE